MRYKKVLSAILTTAMLFSMTGIANAEQLMEAEAGFVTEENTGEAFITTIPGTVSTQEEYSEKLEYVTGYASVNDAVGDRAEFLGTEYHRKVSNGSEFAAAIKDARDKKVKIIELTDDINLGFNNFSAEEQAGYRGFLTQYKKPSPNSSISAMTELGGFTNPEALKNGVSSLKISETDGLTIFSVSGNSLSYAELNVNRNANDIVIRNIHFKNMWQWDDDGNQKAVGWSNLKLNSGTNIWVDHCSFDAAFDGNIDIENGASGISITWCKIGQTPEEAIAPGNAIYDSITFMESLYSEGKLASGLYKKMRDAGATPEQIMQYSAYHDKCHLCGSGDKDCVDYSDTIRDSNGNIRVTLAYNHYRSIGQRLPMIRQGVGHMFNCYIDDSLRQEVLKVEAIKNNATSNYKMSRCINARNGACIAADTCVFNGVEQPIIGAEVQGMDLGNMDKRFQTFFRNAVNRSLIVNSKVVNSKGTYVGSSWDDDGKNAFTVNFNWKDKSTIGNWAWSSTITNMGTNTKEDIEKKVDPYEFEFAYNTDEKLPYEYIVMPLDKVEEVVTAKAGFAGAATKTAEQWCTAYAPVTESELATIAEVTSKIDAIGTVEYTAECKARIDAAEKAYEALNNHLKKCVKNLNVLTAAKEKYLELKAAAEAEKPEKPAEEIKVPENKPVEVKPEIENPEGEKTVASITIDYGEESFDHIYNGKPKKPAVTVIVNGEEVPASDYKLSYKNNKNANMFLNAEGKWEMSKEKPATIYVKFKGAHKGYTLEPIKFAIYPAKLSPQNFDILPKTKKDGVITARAGRSFKPIKKMTYTAEATGKAKTLKLQKDIDADKVYFIPCVDNTYKIDSAKKPVEISEITQLDAGFYLIRVSGINNYYGTCTDGGFELNWK